MSDDLIDTIEQGVRNDLDALGPNPDPSQVADVVARQAQRGAGGDPVIGNQAAQRARGYLEQGMDPETSATLAGAGAHQDAISARSGIQDQARDLLKRQHTADPGVPPVDDVKAYTDLPQQGLSADELATTETVMQEAAESMGAAGVPAPIAAQAELAIANAAAGGQLLPAGLDIHGRLKVTVHDYVDLTFQSSQIKTTKGPTTYTHQGDVKIKATNVRLTADTILIEPTSLEINKVSESKSSSRSIFSATLGLSSTTTTTDDYHSLFGLNAAVAGVNIHMAPVKVGAAFKMTTRGLTRDGIQAFTYENSDAMTRKSNVCFMAASILLIFI
ncbi:hypothetical protein [Bordetella sp. 02P26C-1]|uniref:hypothetical protein n=1 Tax=Bordetella sp. 02P26C-1 TaxID=2683195 RepID=UPI0013546D11|nr:hypothetical protein [Bordetella sp. 02P26C-1]MVW77741.1 hypothetical protein [Bordetella sp. 02P26C-1]